MRRQLLRIRLIFEEALDDDIDDDDDDDNAMSLPLPVVLVLELARAVPTYSW